jgi:hypothetical protein
MKPAPQSLFRKSLVSFGLLAACLAGGCGRSEVPGAIIFSWVLVKASSPDPTTAPPERCPDVGVSKVRLEIGSKYIFDYDCVQNAAQSLTVTADYYHVRVSALSSVGTLLQTKEFPNLYVFGNTKLGEVRLSIP